MDQFQNQLPRRLLESHFNVRAVGTHALFNNSWISSLFMEVYWQVSLPLDEEGLHFLCPSCSLPGSGFLGFSSSPSIMSPVVIFSILLLNGFLWFVYILLILASVLFFFLMGKHVIIKYLFWFTFLKRKCVEVKDVWASDLQSNTGVNISQAQRSSLINQLWR